MQIRIGNFQPSAPTALREAPVDKGHVSGSLGCFTHADFGRFTVIGGAQSASPNEQGQMDKGKYANMRQAATGESCHGKSVTAYFIQALTSSETIQSGRDEPLNLSQGAALPQKRSDCTAHLGDHGLDARPILAGAATRALYAAGAAVVVGGKQVGTSAVTVRSTRGASALTLCADEVTRTDGAAKPAVVLAAGEVNACVAALAQPRGARDDTSAIRASRRTARAVTSARAAVIVVCKQIDAGIAADTITNRTTAGPIDARATVRAAIVTSPTVGIARCGIHAHVVALNLPG